MGGTFLHMLGCMTGLSNPHSQTTARERSVLKKHSTGRKRAVEIGVYEGVTSCLIAKEMAEDGTLYSVDPFLKGRFGICWGKLITMEMLRRSGVGDRVQIVEKYSHDAASHILGQFDFVFVDGDHSLEGITQDWSDWSGRLIPGGIIALHDTLPTAVYPHAGNLGSVDYFDRCIVRDERFDVIEQVDSLSVLCKRF